MGYFFEGDPLILLVKRFSSAYYRLLITRRMPGNAFARQVDVLSSAVEITSMVRAPKVSRRNFFAWR
jgi:hypothetical protein